MFRFLSQRQTSGLSLHTTRMYNKTDQMLLQALLRRMLIYFPSNGTRMAIVFSCPPNKMSST